MAGRYVSPSAFSERGFVEGLLNISENGIGEFLVCSGSCWVFNLENGIGDLVEKGVGDLDFWVRRGAGIGTFCGLRGAGNI